MPPNAALGGSLLAVISNGNESEEINFWAIKGTHCGLQQRKVKVVSVESDLKPFEWSACVGPRALCLSSATWVTLTSEYATYLRMRRPMARELRPTPHLLLSGFAAPNQHVTHRGVTYDH